MPCVSVCVRVWVAHFTPLIAAIPGMNIEFVAELSRYVCIYIVMSHTEISSLLYVCAMCALLLVFYHCFCCFWLYFWCWISCDWIVVAEMLRKPPFPLNHLCKQFRCYCTAIMAPSQFVSDAYLIHVNAHTYFRCISFDTFNWMWIFNQSETCLELHCPTK